MTAPGLFFSLFPLLPISTHISPRFPIILPVPYDYFLYIVQLCQDRRAREGIRTLAGIRTPRSFARIPGGARAASRAEAIEHVATFSPVCMDLVHDPITRDHVPYTTTHG